MMRACVFGSAHGLRRRFLRLDSALCLSLSALVFNAAVGPPALKFLPVCLCVYVCVVVFFFFHGGDGWRREPDVLQAGRTPIWNCVLCPGGFRGCGSCLTMIPDPVCKCCVFFLSRCAATLSVSMALGKLGSGASGATPPLHQRPIVVSGDTHIHKHAHSQEPNVHLHFKYCHLSNFAKMAGILNLTQVLTAPKLQLESNCSM